MRSADVTPNTHCQVIDRYAYEPEVWLLKQWRRPVVHLMSEWLAMSRQFDARPEQSRRRRSVQHAMKRW